MTEKNDQLRDACQEAIAAMEKLKNPEHDEIIKNLEYCVGSYNYDKNPVGLVEYGQKALEILKEAKQKQPRKFKKDILDNLEKSL